MRQYRLKIAINPQMREALGRAQERLMLDNEATTARWLLTYALQQWAIEPAGSPVAIGREGPIGPSNNHIPLRGVNGEGPRGAREGPAEGPPRAREGPARGPYEVRDNIKKQEGEFEGGKFCEQLLPLSDDELDEQIKTCVAILHDIPAWPSGVNKDRLLLRELCAKYPRVDALKVVEKLKIKALDNPIKQRGARSRLAAYFERAEGFGQIRPELAGPSAIKPPALEYEAPADLGLG